MSKVFEIGLFYLRPVVFIFVVISFGTTALMLDLSGPISVQDVEASSLGSDPRPDLDEIGRMPENSNRQNLTRFVGAVNGEAFELVNGPDGPSKVAIPSSRKVFKAFGLTSDGRRLLYTPLKNNIPSGELLIEDLSTGDLRKISDRVVIEASLSPTDDNKVAFTFAEGGTFGLAVSDVAANDSRVLVARDVFAEILQWSDLGDGVHFFQSSRSDTSIDLSKQFESEELFEGNVLWARKKRASTSSNESLEITKKFASISESGQQGRSSHLPAGFPTLGLNEAYSATTGARLRKSNKADDLPLSFKVLSPDGHYEILGRNLLGSDLLVMRSATSGKTVDLGKAQFKGLSNDGVIIKKFDRDQTVLKFVEWSGAELILGTTVVNFNLPISDSVMTQGGMGYGSPGNCNITAHSGHLEYAYDFQKQVVGTHAMATADGLVVFTESSVTCNSVQTTCPAYSGSGCPGSFLGNVVVIQHADGTYSKYAHLETNSPQAVVGTAVDQGLYIGRQGHTGSTSGSFNSCGDHLHFQRQISPDIYGQSIPVDFSDVASEPLSCGTTYTSGSVEISHSITPSSQTFPVGGGNGSITVTSTGGTWSATSNSSWITLIDPGSGTGNDTVLYTIADNSSGGPRTGTLTVGGHIFTVDQAGAQPLNLPPSVDAGPDLTGAITDPVNLVGSATDDGLPNPPSALTVVWSVVDGPGAVVFQDSSSINTTANFGLAGFYTLRLTVDDGELVASDDVRVLINSVGGGGHIVGTRSNSPASVDLTNEGTSDWAHWGLDTATSFNHMGGVGQQISDYSLIGNTSALRFVGNPTSFSWNNGLPNSLASTNTGVFTYDVGSGFEVNLPADTTERTLRLYVGLWRAGGRLEAAISDGSASPFLDTSFVDTTGNSLGYYKLNYKAASSGQTLVIRWTVDSSYHSIGNISLQAASLSLTPVPVNQAPVVNAGSDMTVTLPGTANMGGTASDDGLPNPPASVTTTWSTVSGPGTVTFGDVNALNTTASFSQAGTYVVRLTGDDGSLTATDEVTVTVNAAGGSGSLSVTSAVTPTGAVDLSAEGTADWAHWGLTSAGSFNRKSGVTQQISNYTRVGTGTIQQFGGNPTLYNWTGGTPTGSATNVATGLWVIGQNNGYQVTVPADTAVRTLKMYVGLWAAGGRFEASLSDGSAPVYVDTSLSNSTATSNRVYTLNYQAAASGQTLTVRWVANTTYNAWSNVTLQAATLSGGTAPTPTPMVPLWVDRFR